MKIFTSYWAKLAKLKKSGLQPISISRHPPRYVSVADYKQYSKFAPHSFMLKLSEVEYYQHFNKMLEELNVEDVVNELKDLSGNKDIVLLCYEKEPCDCHRHRVAEWLNEKGIKVEEYVWEKKSESKYTQLNLFL